MSIRIAINGYGRVGRCVLRALQERQGLSDSKQIITIVAINEMADADTVAHLTRYDTTHGRFKGKVTLKRSVLDRVEVSNIENNREDNRLNNIDLENSKYSLSSEQLIIDNHSIHLFQQSNIEKLPWQALNIDIVLECTGAFADRKTAQKHIDSGAKKVIFSQPAEADVDATVVYGVNHQSLKATDTIISNSSCTTNAIAPVLKIIDEFCGVEHGIIRTIHSAMHDQPVIDAYHNTDLRKTRAAFQSIIPVDTALAKGIGRIFPKLDGCFEAHAIRVPTLNVSALDVTITLKKAASVAAINSHLQQRCHQFKDIMTCTEEPLASCDFNHDSHSAIIDINQTRMAGAYLLKLFVWFDNEWGYANRMLDVVSYFYLLDD